MTDTIIAFIQRLNLVYPRPTILFSEGPDTQSVNKVIKAGISAYIVSGIESKRIKSIIDIAAARFKEQQHLKSELKKTRSKLEERKLMDRAKGILIKTQGLSVDEAYHTLRKLAILSLLQYEMSLKVASYSNIE